MVKEKRALVVSYNRAPFVLYDHMILSEMFDTELYLTGREKKSLLYTGYRLSLLFKKILLGKYNLLYVWGLDFNGMVPSILKNFMKFRLVVVPLGYELNKMEEINYGNSNKFKDLITVYVSKKADRVICTSKYISNQAEKMGIKSRVVYLCLDMDS